MRKIARLFIGRSHYEPPARIGGLAPSSYGLIVQIDNRTHEHWGFGAEKTTDAMFAHGLLRGAEIAWIEDPDYELEVITPGAGSKDYLKYVVKWLRDQEMGHDISRRSNFQIWKKVLAFDTLGQLDIRKPSDSEERTICVRARRLAIEAQEMARLDWQDTPAKYASPGVFRTDEVPVRC